MIGRVPFLRTIQASPKWIQNNIFLFFDGDIGREDKKLSRVSKIKFLSPRLSPPANPRLPGFDPLPRYTSCTTGTQGISVGWMDVYDKDLFGQWIDVSQLRRGRYGLEPKVDPVNRIRESNETNNTSRIMVFIE